MKNKSGLSTIITTLILILLVLALILIFWIVIRNLIIGGSDDVDLGRFTIDLDIKNAYIEETNNDVIVRVRRNPGKGNLVGMTFVFEATGEDDEKIRVNETIPELGERIFTIHLNEMNVSVAEKVHVALIYGTESGKEVEGDIIDSYRISDTPEEEEEEIPPTEQTVTYLVNATGNVGWKESKLGADIWGWNECDFYNYSTSELNMVSEDGITSSYISNSNYTQVSNCHRIRFNITEAAADITQIDVLAKQQCGVDYGLCGNLTLSIGNINSLTWERLDGIEVATNGVKYTHSGSLTSGILPYVNESGEGNYVYILLFENGIAAPPQIEGLLSHNNYFDYINITSVS